MRLLLPVSLSVVLLLSGCGGGGGGSRTEVPGPGAGASGTVPPPVEPSPPVSEGAINLAEADQLHVVITSVAFGDDGRAFVTFNAFNGDAAGDTRWVSDVTADDVRFTLAKLQRSTLGSATGTWQSYINRIEEPGIGEGLIPRLQATAERGTAGELEPLGEGSYRYRFALSVLDQPDDIAEQAGIEGLDLAYDASLTHRVAMQLGNAPVPANPVYDFVPESGETAGIARALIVATPSCNNCHRGLALHGGGRVETDYCVTCHNPGTADANSTNNLDMAEMVHKIHRGADLPSVRSGGAYRIYGFRDSLHDYSGVHYPRAISDCTVCHAGSATPSSGAIATANGDNWHEYPARQPCGACHDDTQFQAHYGGQPDDSRCRSCHATGGIAGSVIDSHRDLVAEAVQRYRFEIVDVQQTAPGAFPEITFRVVNPQTGDSYDIRNDEAFVQGGGASRLAASIAWSTADYHNTGNGRDNASSVAIALPGDAVETSAGQYRVTSAVPVPDGTEPPFIAASGSGVATLEGHPAEVIAGSLERLPVPNVLAHFAITEPDGVAQPRRQVVSLQQCQACHGSLSLHGNNRTDNIEGCATCHNPRNTDRSVREIAQAPPTDGKQEQSIDLKVMIHAIHAAGFRESPLQVVGFRGLNTHVFDEESVHYPAPIEDCNACHVDNAWSLPLTESVLGTTIDTGSDRTDPGDDVVVSPVTAVCSSCHDRAEAAQHMLDHGGSFSTRQSALASGQVSENCTACHGPGESSDTGEVHDLSL